MVIYITSKYPRKLRKFKNNFSAAIIVCMQIKYFHSLSYEILRWVIDEFSDPSDKGTLLANKRINIIINDNKRRRWITTIQSHSQNIAKKSNNSEIEIEFQISIK